MDAMANELVGDELEEYKFKTVNPFDSNEEAIVADFLFFSAETWWKSDEVIRRTPAINFVQVKRNTCVIG